MFTVDQGGKVVVDPNLLMIPSINVIYNKDKSKTKDSAYLILAGIYFIADTKSPFNNYPEDKKNKEVNELYFKKAKVSIKDIEIQNAIQEYKSLNLTPSQCILEATRETLFKLADHIKRAPITSGKDGNITQIQNSIEKIQRTLVSYDIIKQAVDKEQISQGKKIGQTIIGNREL